MPHYYEPDPKCPKSKQGKHSWKTIDNYQYLTQRCRRCHQIRKTPKFPPRRDYAKERADA